MRISDWSSDMCSSDLQRAGQCRNPDPGSSGLTCRRCCWRPGLCGRASSAPLDATRYAVADLYLTVADSINDRVRSEEHTSELQSLMRISYAVFCLKKKTTHQKSLDHTSNI